MKRYEKTLLSLDDGAFVVEYNQKSYLATKQSYTDGKVIKFYAYELGGRDFVSCNLYITKKSLLLKPCEMSPAKVREFLEMMQLKGI